MQDKVRSLARLVREQFPAHFTDYESRLIDLVQAYYDWEYLEGNSQYDIVHLLDYLDVNTAPEEFKDILVYELLPGLAQEVVTDRVKLARYIVEFYKSKGSIRSLEFLFRILYNEEISISLPKERILKPSDGIWQKKTFIKTEVIDENIVDSISRRIVGSTSGASAIVEAIRFFSTSNHTVAELELSAVTGEFSINELVYTVEEENRVYSVVIGQVVNYNVISKGSGYTAGQVIDVSSQGDGEGFVAIVDTVDIDGGILKINIVDTGIGFSTVPPVLNLESQLGSSGASIVLSIGGTYRSPGAYFDFRGHPSGTSRIHDGKYFQEYSYVIRTKTDIALWKEIVLRNAHPAGMEVFSERLVLNDEESSIANLQPEDLIVNQETFFIRRSESGEYRQMESGYIRHLEY